MATEAQNRERIAKCQWPELDDLWRQIKTGQTPDWDPGKAFEYLIIRAFELNRAEVEWPFEVKVGEVTESDSSGVLEQIDGFVWADGIACLVECKDWNEDLDVAPIAKLRNQLLRRTNQLTGVLFSRGGFTFPARLSARFLAPQVILLWSGEDVDCALAARDFVTELKAKYQACLARGVPNLKLKMGWPGHVSP